MRRAVNIFGDATADELGSPPTEQDNVREDMVITRVNLPDNSLLRSHTDKLVQVPIQAEGHSLRHTIAFTVRNTINFMTDYFDPFGDHAEPLPLAPTDEQREDRAYINRIAQYNRGVILFHEVNTVFHP